MSEGRRCWWCHMGMAPDGEPWVTPIGHDDVHVSCAEIAIVALRGALARTERHVSACSASTPSWCPDHGHCTCTLTSTRACALHGADTTHHRGAAA